MPLHFATGTLGDEVAHLLGGMALALSFALLYQRRVGAMIHVYALQGMVLGLEAAWQALLRPAAILWLVALITITAKSVALPHLLRRAVRPLRVDDPVERAIGVVPLLVFGVGLVTLATAAVMPTALSADAPTREELALALSVVLLGALMIVTQSRPGGQVVGVLSMENGVILAAISAPGMPFVLELVCAFLGLAAVMVFALRWLAEKLSRAGATP